MDSQGLQGHLSRARDGHKQLHRNNVLFDTLLPSGRKGDDSQRKHTNLFFMLGLFTQCSHPYFYPSLSVSHCLRSFLSPPPVHLYFPKDDLMIWSVCVCVHVCRKFDTWCPSQGACIRQTHTHAHICSLRVMLRHCLICAWWEHQDQVVWFSLHDITEADTTRLPFFLHKHTILFPCIPGSRCSL